MSSLIIGAKTIMDNNYSDISFFIENLIPSVGVILFAGAPKIGKSWFVLQMLLFICYDKKEFLGHTIKNKANALYLSLEDSESRIKARILKQGINPDDNRLSFSFNWPADGNEIQNLEDFLKKNPEVKLICIDTKGKFTLGRIEESYQLDYDWMSKMKQLTDKYKVAIILVTHLRKRKADEDPYEQISGSNGNTGAADTIIMLKRNRNQYKGYLSLTSRDFPETEEEIIFEPNTCTWTKSRYETHPYITPERYQILSTMKQIGTECSPKEIAEFLGADNKNISNMLSTMKTLNLVERGSKSGLYKIKGDSNEI